MQVIRHAYQLREGTAPDMGPPAQALQPLAAGEHHYPVFKHFPASAVKLQVSTLQLLTRMSCLYTSEPFACLPSRKSVTCMLPKPINVISC